jgi:hypothetical protein
VNKIACPLECEVPDGVNATETPPTRHNWGDVFRCPNGVDEGLSAPCGRTFLITETDR